LRTSRRKRVWIVIRLSLLILAAIIALFPFYWALNMTFRSKSQIFSTGLFAIPFVQFKPTLENWINEISVVRENQNALINSTIIALSSALLALSIGSLAAYALARFNFQRVKNKDMLMWFISLRILPPIVLAIPFFLMMRQLHLLDTRLALIIAYTNFNLPLVVVIMTQMFRNIPKEIEESAFVDGCSHFGTFIRIALPLSAPGLIAVSLLAFAFSWNEFLFALTLTFSKAITIPLVIAGARSNQGIDFIFVATKFLLAVGPPVVLALSVQRFLVRGLTLGAVKE